MIIKNKTRLKLFFIFSVLLTLTSLSWPQSKTDATVHMGPTLDIKVKRDDEILPWHKVDKLQSGDRLYVNFFNESSSRGDWLIVLATVLPNGSEVFSRRFNLKDNSEAFIDIKNNDELPVIVLAPQLKTFFGLARSFSSSADLIDEIIKSEPQKFYELRQVDLVNKAIRVISLSLERIIAEQTAIQSIESAKLLAFKYGVKNINPECYKNNYVNIECIALNIVSNRDFTFSSIPNMENDSQSKKNTDSLGFLGANFRIFTDAGNFLTDKFRDKYVFVPTFGRRKSGTDYVQLFSLGSFKSGDIKTAYVYTPSWFSGASPELSISNNISCFNSGRLDVNVMGKLPLGDYWHSWKMDIFDINDPKKVIGNTTQLQFVPNDGLFLFNLPNFDLNDKNLENVDVKISGKFGFQNISIKSKNLILAKQSFNRNDFIKINDLISGEQGYISLKASPSNVCVKGLEIIRDGNTLAKSSANSPTELKFDFHSVPPGPAKLLIKRFGLDSIFLDLAILQPKAKISRIEHLEFEKSINIKGSNIDRIDFLKWGGNICKAYASSQNESILDEKKFVCVDEIISQTKLPDYVDVFYQNNEPNSFRHPIVKTHATPRVSVATEAKNAILIEPSQKAIQWGLKSTDEILSDDSGLYLLLKVDSGYLLKKSAYFLQIRVKDDVSTNNKPITVPLIVDFVSGELRTRNAVYFKSIEFPSIANQLEYRVLQENTGLSSSWSLLDRTVVTLPDIKYLSCGSAKSTYWLHGAHLDLIDDAVDITLDPDQSSKNGTLLKNDISLESCGDGLCLRLKSAPSDAMRITLRWFEEVHFKVKIPQNDLSCD